MADQLWLIPLGLAVGAYGTLIGVGGGFVLVPLLLLLFPDESPEVITTISLAVVFVNALSGSWAYARMRRIDYRSGLLFAAATIPGAILGAFTTAYISRRLFDLIFGLFLMAGAALLLLRPLERQRRTRSGRRTVARTLMEADGTTHTYSFNPLLGTGISLFVGFISSLLGIGGGIIHVPVLVHLLTFPVHVATATSQFVLAIMALTGTITHIVSGTFSQGVGQTVLLAAGVIPGAQLGAYLSRRVQGSWIMRALAVALGLVGIRLLVLAW